MLTKKIFMNRRLPFKLAPAPKDYLWGGNRLNDDFNFKIPIYPFAEAWMCSTHPDGPSVVADSSTVFAGMVLQDVLRLYPEYLGTHPLQITGGKVELPILIKLIDAKQDLSVQVHPDDEYAAIYEDGLGKTEMWYVLDAKNDSELVYGFSHDVDEEQVRKAIEAGTITDLLNHVPVYRDDLFYIEAGTVHAIGAGILLAEIQENSNITYRLYDYGRIDKNGQTRPLHIDKALEVARLNSSSTPRQPMRVLKYKNGTASELLTRCKYFQVERMLLNTAVRREMAAFRTDSNSFHVLLVVDGCGMVIAEDVNLPFFKGDCIFVPAESVELKLHGKAQMLNVSC